ncbi:MAG: calcium-binding protein, partial [Sphaerochaetaceae bacterium]
MTEIMGMLFGRQATLVTYDMAPLEFNFKWTKSFAIVGPLCADVGFNFGVCMDLEFGYDTLGLAHWKESNFKDTWALLDGFYIDDMDPTNTKDVSEIIFHSGIIAGASIAGRAGVNVALNLDLNLNLNDPNNDGKVRFYELYENFEKSPLAIFDTSATIEAEAYAYLNYFIGTKKWTLWKSGALEIFNTEKDPTPTLATEQNGDVVVNVGDYASKRNIGDLSDGVDTVVVTVTGKNKVTIKYGNTTSDEYTINSGNTLIINSGKGNDDISFVNSSSTSIAFNIQINGGEGNDRIDLSAVTFDTDYYAILAGGAGDDTIIGSKGKDYIFGDEGYVVYKEDESTENTSEKSKTSKIVKTAEAYVDSGVAGNDQIFAGSGDDVVFGGGGADFISGDDGADILFGDGGRVEYDAAGKATASRSNLFDDGGNDTIYGGAGGDFIYAGAGNDNVDAGSGDDFVNGDKGVDVVYGGSGDDTIDGGDGVDVLFGGTPATGLLLAQENSIAGVLPWAYVSSDLKKDGSRLLKDNQIKLFDFLTDYSNKTGISVSALTVTNVAVTENDDDTITGGLGSDIIFGDAGLNDATGGNDVLSGGVGNDFIDGDGGNDRIAGETGEDILYGGAGNDTLDGGAGDDIVFGDDGWEGYASGVVGVSDSATSGLYAIYSNTLSSTATDEQKNVFGAGMAAFAKNFRIQSTAVAKKDGGNDVIAAGQGSDFVDGQSGDDTYNVKFFGEYNLGYTNVMDSGTDAADSMTVYGTSDADELLIRASKAGLGFVALLPDSDPETDAGKGKTKLERVNFWSDASRPGSGMDQMTVNAGLGDDEIAVDSTLSSITVNGEGGDDSITVGQLYHSARGTDALSANVASLDAFSTTETTQGFLSDGVNAASSITGGTGNDTITVLHTSAALSLSGNSGDDTFNIFGFLDTDLKPLMNGPMLVNGGAGTDALSIAGSEGDDTIVYTAKGVSATGVSVQSINVEKDSAYGGAGDDSFYLLSSTEEQKFYLNGGLGNDSFYNGGVQTDANYIEVENADYRGHSGQIDHTVTASGTTDYVSGAASSISVNIVDDDETASDATTVQVVFTNATGGIADPSPVISEGTSAIAYYVALSKAPAAGESVQVTVFAPGVSDGDLQRGDRGILLAANAADAPWRSYVTLTFTASNWNVGQAVRALAPSDLLREGDMTVGLLHSTKVVPASGSTTANTKVGLCRNVFLSVKDESSMNSTDGFAVTQKIFLTAADLAANKIVLGLDALPELKNIQIWREGSSKAVTGWSLEGNSLYIPVSSGLSVGTVFYVHYTSSALVIENQSEVNLSYEMNDGVTPAVALVESDDACTVQPQTSGSSDRYYYALNGTALSFYDTEKGTLQTLSGNFVGLFASAWTGGASMTLARDVRAGTAVIFKDAAENSISILSKNNARSEDPYYYDYDTATKILTVYNKATDAAVSMTGTVSFYSTVVFSDASSIALDSSFVSGSSVILTVSHVSFIPREGNQTSDDIYYYRIDGTQLVIFNSNSNKPQSVTGTIVIAGHSLVTPPDEAISTADVNTDKVLIEPTDGSTDVAETKNAAGKSVYTDSYTITLQGAKLTGAQSVTVSIDPVSTPYMAMDGSRGKAVQVEVYEIDFVSADDTRTVIATLASDGADALKSVTFTAASWAAVAGNKTACGKFYVCVRAIDDSVAESDALSVIPVGKDTIADIKGTTHEDGAGEDGPELPEEPKLLHYGVVLNQEHKDHEYTVSPDNELTSGTPVITYETLSEAAKAKGQSSFQSDYEFVGETAPDTDGYIDCTYRYSVTERSTEKDSTTVKVTKTPYTMVRKEKIHDELNGYAHDFAATISGKTITIAKNAAGIQTHEDKLKDSIANGTHYTIVATAGAEEGEVREIESAKPDENGNYVVTLNKAFSADAAFRCTVGVVRPSLFVNEEECTDRIFVNNQDNSSAATDALNTLSSTIAETPVIQSEWTDLLNKVTAKLAVMDALSNLSSAISAASGIDAAMATLSSAINGAFASDSNVTSAWNALSSAVTAQLDATAALNALATAVVTNLDVKAKLDVVSSSDNVNFVSNYVISSNLNKFASALDKQLQDIDNSKTLAMAIETQSDVNKAFSALSLAFSSAFKNAAAASESDLLLGKNPNALRFTHSDLAVSGINFANMDYAELNLGSGKDTFTANAAVSRADAFQTFTVVNAGAGNDVISVNSYKSMTGTQIAAGTLAYGGSITTSDFEEQYNYTLSSLISSEPALLNTNLTGYFVEITDASGATERREIVEGTLASGATITLARNFTMAVTAGTSFRIVGQVISSGTIQTPAMTGPAASAEVSSVTLSSVFSLADRSLRVGDVLVLREVISAADGSTSYGEASRHVITAVSGSTVTFNGAVEGDGRSYTYRIETKLSDDQLVINAQEGNDTVTATGDITRKGLIVFGGYGADAITVDNSAYVFGDRGQVIYTDVNGKVVTR